MLDSDFSATQMINDILGLDGIQSAILNIIKVGRLLEVEDERIYALILEFDTFKAACPTAAQSLENADATTFGQNFVSLNGEVQAEKKQDFSKRLKDQISLTNQFNLFVDILRPELFEQQMQCIEASQLDFVHTFSQFESQLKENIQSKVKSTRQQNILSSNIESSIIMIENNQEKLHYLQSLLERIAELSEIEILRFFNIPLSINQLASLIQEKIEEMDLDETARNLMQYSVQTRLEAIPTILREENLTQQEMGASNWAQWQMDYNYFQDLNLPDSILVTALKMSCEKQAEVLNQTVSKITRLVRFDSPIKGSMPRDILKLLHQHSQYDDKASFESQHASLEYQRKALVKFEEDRITTHGASAAPQTIEDLRLFLINNPFQESAQPRSSSAYVPLPLAHQPQISPPENAKKSSKIQLFSLAFGGSTAALALLVLTGVIPAVGPLALLKGLLGIYQGLSGVKAAGFLVITSMGSGALITAVSETITRLMTTHYSQPKTVNAANDVRAHLTPEAGLQTPDTNAINIEALLSRPAAIVPLRAASNTAPVSNDQSEITTTEDPKHKI